MKIKKFTLPIIVALVLTAIGAVFFFSDPSLFQGKFVKQISNRLSNQPYQTPLSNLNPLKSQLLKSDPAAQKILSSGSYDLSNQDLYTLQLNQYADSLPYKFFVALHMLGYQNSTDPFKSSDFVLSLFHRFQQTNGMAVSSSLDADALLKLDDMVFQKEQAIKDYSKKTGTFFESLSAQTLNAKFSKDYIAWIYTYPLEVLPKYMTGNLTPSNYFMCIYRQCTGSVKKFDGDAYLGSEINANTYSQGNFLFFPDIFPNDISNYVYVQKSLMDVSVIVHEFAHYLDGNVYADLPEFNSGIIDTTDFYAISFIPNTDGSYFTCSVRKTDNVKDFITRYPLYGANSGQCPGYGPEYGTPFEDFADSFTAYVLAGEVFREAAKNNASLQQKYDWLKINVFLGSEYATNFPYSVSYDYAGCNDAPDTDPSGGPFYLSCNNDYVWDGQINVLEPLRTLDLKGKKFYPINPVIPPSPDFSRKEVENFELPSAY